MQTRAGSTTNSCATITCGSKWGTAFTSSHMAFPSIGLPGKTISLFFFFFKPFVCVIFYHCSLRLGFRLEKLWVQNGTTFFFGPIFIHPEETVHEPTKMFYKREVFLSHLEETLPMTCVIGAVLIPDKDSISIMCPFLPAPFFFVVIVLFLLSTLCLFSQANAWCPRSKTTCHADLRRLQKRIIFFARAAT